jgi:hypothetical protein
MRALSFLAGAVGAAACAAMALPAAPQTEAQCEARPRLYEQDTDHHRYYVLWQDVYRRDGIPWERRHEYENDHIIPWCACGTDNPANLQVQPLAEARRKDLVERAICAALRDGRMSLRDAQAYFREGRWK